MQIEVIYVVNGTTCTDLIEVDEEGATAQIGVGYGLVRPHGVGTLDGRKIEAALYANAERIVKYEV